MTQQSPKKWNIWTPILVFFILSIGILLGYFISQMEYKNNSSNHRPGTSQFSVVQRSGRIEEIIKLIDEEYIDEFGQDSIYNTAIKSLISLLDPHSNYIHAEELGDYQNRLQGNFKGVGAEFVFIHDTVMLTHIIPNSPAEEAGLKSGSLLIKVDDELVSSVEMESDDLINYILGESGTKIKFEILELPGRKNKTIEIARGNVPLESIDASYLLNDDIAYIKINRFSATSYREFVNALSQLQEQGSQSLIIDLRQNQGGYVDAAIAIADELLDENKVIVSIDSRHFGIEHYYAELEGIFEEGKLAILIDEGTASASEILAGAIQDWDRGWIIGRRSFGKGLVQELFDLRDGSSIKLTTSKYFTPIGRNIQRPYLNKYHVDSLNPFPIYEDEIVGLRNNKDYRVVKDTSVYHSKILNRTIYGGGGIKPDIIIPIERREEYLGDLYGILASQELRYAAYEYVMYHYDDIADYKDIDNFSKNFQLPDFVLDELLKKYNKEHPNKTIKWTNPKGKEYIRKRVSGIIARIKFGPNGYFYYQHFDDKHINTAVEQIKGNYSLK